VLQYFTTAEVKQLYEIKLRNSFYFAEDAYFKYELHPNEGGIHLLCALKAREIRRRFEEVKHIGSRKNQEPFHLVAARGRHSKAGEVSRGAWSSLLLGS
jgi:hypothetical protein